MDSSADPAALTAADRAAMAKIRAVALDALSRREHGSRELHTKLVRKFDQTLVQAVISGLLADGLLSDRRYAEALIRRRISRGYGPRYIVGELAQKGIERTMIDECLDFDRDFWMTKVMELVEKRGGMPVEKTLRFLGRRGFPSDLIYKAIR